MAFDYSIFRQALTSFDFGVGGALIGILLILVSAIIITRDTRNMRLVLFPLAVGFYQIGLFEGTKFIPYTIIAFTAVVWIVTLTGAHIIGSTLAGAGEAIRNIGSSAIRGTARVGWYGTRKTKDYAGKGAKGAYEKIFASGLAKKKLREEKSQREYDVKKLLQNEQKKYLFGLELGKQIDDLSENSFKQKLKEERLRILKKEIK